MRLSIYGPVLLALVVGGCSTPQPFSEAHNLNFRLEGRNLIPLWAPGNGFSAVYAIDSSETINGKYPLVLSQPKVPNTRLFKKFFPLRVRLQQRIALPETAADSMIVSLNCRNRNLQKAQLVVSGIGPTENLLYSDSLSIISDNWNVFSLPVSLKNARFLHFTIAAKGVIADSVQAIWLDRIELRINGKRLDDLGLPEPTGNVTLKRKNIRPLSFEDSRSIESNPGLGTKKILAIGESVHGSETINKAAFQLIKYQVKKNNCKLILLEAPLSESLSYNRFIQGDEGFTIDRLFRNYNKALSRDQLIALLQWLKTYNKTTENKVWLLGIDIDLSQLRSGMWLFNYLFSVNQTMRNPTLDSLYTQLLREDGIEKAFEMTKEDNKLAMLLGDKEHEVLLHCLRTSVDMGKHRSRRFPARDSIMYENAKFLFELLCGNSAHAVSYSHLGHANYKTTHPAFLTPAFGSYMKSYFGEAYSCIGLLVETGTVSVLDSAIMKIKPLQSPSPGSVEYRLAKYEGEYMYAPAPGQIVAMRGMGIGYMSEQFASVIPSERMDGIVFIRNSRAVPTSGDTSISYDAGTIGVLMMMENMERLKNHML